MHVCTQNACVLCRAGADLLTSSSHALAAFDISEQNILSCMTGAAYSSSQCNWGNVPDVFRYINNNHVTTEAR